MMKTYIIGDIYVTKSNKLYKEVKTIKPCHQIKQALQRS